MTAKDRKELVNSYFAMLFSSVTYRNFKVGPTATQGLKMWAIYMIKIGGAV